MDVERRIPAELCRHPGGNEGFAGSDGAVVNFDAVHQSPPADGERSKRCWLRADALARLPGLEPSARKDAEGGTTCLRHALPWSRSHAKSAGITRMPSTPGSRRESSPTIAALVSFTTALRSRPPIWPRRRVAERLVRRPVENVPEIAPGVGRVVADLCQLATCDRQDRQLHPRAPRRAVAPIRVQNAKDGRMQSWGKLNGHSSDDMFARPRRIDHTLPATLVGV